MFNFPLLVVEAVVDSEPIKLKFGMTKRMPTDACSFILAQCLYYLISDYIC